MRYPNSYDNQSPARWLRDIVIRAIVFSVFGLAITCCGVVPASAQLVNGSFEQGLFTSINPAGDLHTTALGNGNGNISGWISLNQIAWLEPGNPYHIAASDGSRVLDLTGYANHQPEGGIEQTVTLDAGNTYALGFDVGYSPDYPTSPDGVTVTIAASGVRQTFNNPNSGVGTTVGTTFWQRFTLDFTPIAATNTIVLQGSNVSSGDFIGLDNVTLIQDSSSVVPEPGKLALGDSLIVLSAGFLLRRKRDYQSL